LLLGDSYPNWLTYKSEGSSITFVVPRGKGRNLKTIMTCIVYSSAPDNITSDGLTALLVKNYTKATIQLYKRGAIAAFEDEVGQRVVSSLEPGNKVEVAFVFEYRFIVKKITLYLSDEPIAEKVEECHVNDKNVVLCSGDENDCFVRKVSSHVIVSSGEVNECFIREASSHAQDKNEPIISSGDENDCLVRKGSPQGKPMDENDCLVKKVSHAINKNEPIVSSGDENEYFVSKVSSDGHVKNVTVSSGDENVSFISEASSHAQDKNELIVCSGEENEGFVRKVSSNAPDKNVIVSSGDENECFAREVSSNAQDKNEPIVCSDGEKESFVRKVSPQVAPVDDLKHNKKKKILKSRWKTVREWLGKYRCC
jgi:hypothetical protein